eukprot:12144003-Alexandrium_andersonii.AAC.1
MRTSGVPASGGWGSGDRTCSPFRLAFVVLLSALGCHRRAEEDNTEGKSERPVAFWAGMPHSGA